MHRLILWWGIIFLFLVFPSSAIASDVVLNEIFANPLNEDDEFIELYNNSDSEIDLSGWSVADLVKIYSIVDLKISPKSFLTLDKSLTGIALNNSNETVKLLDKDGIILDSYSYESTIEDKSFSRITDGVGEFSNGVNTTKNSPNAPAPTPTPTETPKPTKIPTATKAPSATKVPTITKQMSIATSQVADEDLYEEKNSRAVTKLPSTSVSIKNNPTVGSSSRQSVKGVSDEVVEDKESSSVGNDSESYLYSLTTGIGMLILACGILLYRKFKVRKEEDDF